MPEQMITYAHSGGDAAVGSADGPPGFGPAVVKTERLTKRIRGVYALRNVSLTVRPGEIYGLVGVQGAGKSTLAQLLLGLMRPDSGTIALFGSANLPQTRARLGYLPEQPRYHGNFTGSDYLRFHAGLSGLKAREAQLAANKVAELVGLGGAACKLIGGYSKVARQRLGLAVALLSGGAEPPELLALDEPATGFDEETAATFRDVVLDCQARGSTVLICSRELTAVERTCTSIGILRAGRLLVQTQIDNNPRTHIVGVAREGAAEIRSHLVEYLGSLHPSVVIRGGALEGEHLHVVLPAGSGVPHAVAMKAAALRAMVDARWDIVSVYSENRDLESIFLQALPSSAGNTKSLLTGSTESPRSTAVMAVATPATGPLEPLAVAPVESAPQESRSAWQGMPQTGPLPTLEVERRPEPPKSSVTGPLGALEPGEYSSAGGNGVVPTERGAATTGPSTAPLPALTTEGAVDSNGYRSLLPPPPLPVRSVSSARSTEVVTATTIPASDDVGGENGEGRG